MMPQSLDNLWTKKCVSTKSSRRTYDSSEIIVVAAADIVFHRHIMFVSIAGGGGMNVDNWDMEALMNVCTEY